jgi:hypothetical protein
MSVYESPIEERLGEMLQTVFDSSFPPGVVEIVPQYKSGRFRYDFAINMPWHDTPIFLIECDGKEFHRTAKQVENDRRKDLHARQIGSVCLRYTGSCIWQKSIGIAVELAAMVEYMRRWHGHAS